MRGRPRITINFAGKFLEVNLDQGEANNLKIGRIQVLCGRTASQLKAIAWTNTHPHFMTLQIVRPDLTQNRPSYD